MATATDGTTNISYTYDSDGIRTSKTVNGTKHTYVYASGKLLRETFGDTTLDFFYSTSGQPYALKHNGTTYYYITNVQGDVMSIVDGTGAVVAEYEYDPYGNILSTTGTLADTLGQINPLRYRGYVYDQESNLYYLQSRYYDPSIGRFPNPDSYPSTGLGLTGSNMFAYCGNNPVLREDARGTFWLSAVVGAVVNVATTYIAAKATGQDYTWKDATVAAVSGAANAIPVVGPLLSGTITGVYTGVMASQNGANLGESIVCGAVAAVCTTASISNLANIQKPALDVVTAAVADLVFGTGYNGMAAATYKAITTNASSATTK